MLPRYIVWGFVTIIAASCTLQGLDEGLERQACETRSDCTDLNSIYPNADPCLEWTCNRTLSLCQVRGRDRDDDQVVDIACPGGLDCNDQSDQVYPGAPESCDGLDNNCDSRVDEHLYQATRTHEVLALTSVIQGGPISVAHDPENQDALYATIADIDQPRIGLAMWTRGETTTATNLTLSEQNGAGTQNIAQAGVLVDESRAHVAMAAYADEGSSTCLGIHTGPLTNGRVEVPATVYGPGLPQRSGAQCPNADDGIFSPQPLAHDPEFVLWLAREGRSFPQIRQCSNPAQSSLYMTTTKLESARLVTSNAVGFEPFASLEVGSNRSLVAVAEDRGGTDTGVYFYIVSGDKLVPVVTTLGLGLHAIQPRYVRLERGNFIGDGDVLELTLTIQAGCLRDAAIVVQRFLWEPSKTWLRSNGRPYQIIARDLPGQPALFGASTVWNGSDWFVAWNEGGSKVRLRRLSPVAETLQLADEHTLFESTGSLGGFGAPHTFLDSSGRPLIVAQAGTSTPGLRETVIECID